MISVLFYLKNLGYVFQMLLWGINLKLHLYYCWSLLTIFIIEKLWKYIIGSSDVSQNVCKYKSQGCRNCPLPLPIFRSVNPIPTSGADSAHPLLLTPQFFSPSGITESIFFVKTEFVCLFLCTAANVMF